MLAITGLLVMQTVDQALAGVVLPSGAGTLTIGPQAMEGNLQIHTGDTIKAGYDFTMPGAHAAAQVTVDNASITMTLTCGNGTTPILNFALPVQTYGDPASSSSWFPSADQSNAAVYQGSVTAPDLCAGSLMSDPNGATFKATIFSTDTTDKVNFRFHYSDNTSGSWSVTVAASPTPTAKTVLTATLTPMLGLTLGVDHSSAIPGDPLSYSGTVTNTGATLTIGGDFTASASGSGSAAVKSYWDDVATSLDSTTWTALAGTSAAQSGYTPAVAPPISAGMTLSSTAVAANGVTYPAGGDPLLGTTMAAGSSALWHYTARVPLTPSQVTTLLDPTKTKAVRNSFHLEVSPANPNITQPSISNVDFSGIFFGASPLPSGAVNNVTVTVQPPSGSAVTITSATVPALASLATGAAANYSTTYKVPVPAAKGATESDGTYQSRLAGIEGSSLTASASASGSSTGGSVSANAPSVSTTEHLPIVSIAKSGPSTVTAGTTATFPLALKNSGGATASGFTITDTVPSGDTGIVSGTPASLAPGASSTGVQATYAVPGAQTPGNLTDTASVTWHDANGNSYGPMSSSFTAVVQNPLLGARLTLALAAGDAGLMPINGSQGLQLTLLNSAGAPIVNQAVTVNITGANPSTVSATTDANGQATVSYTGKTSGVDQLQATATSASATVSSNTVSVTWINPIQPVATTPIQGNFYSEDPSLTTFAAKPGDSAAFQQSFPTINFNPPANTVPHNVSGVGPTTVPFTDVTTDAVGNFAGTIVAQGNGVQAGSGTLSSFDAALSANFVVSQPQDVTFKIFADDGFILGVGGGASRVSGTLQNAPASGVTPFNGYTVVGAYNTGGAAAPGTYTVTVHFPSAGAYPYELDYFECCAAQMSLTMTVVSVNAGPYNLFTGYGDTTRPAGNRSFPFPWNGASNTTFIGDGAPYDTGGLRFDNNTNQPITLSHVTVDIGTHHYDPWNLNLTVPSNGTLILAGAGSPSSFDTSEAVGTKAGSGGGSSGFAASQFATGFLTCCGGIGPVGVAFDNSGNLFAMNYATGFLYKFGPNGGVAGPSTQVNANAIFGCPAGLAFSKDGKHLYLAVQCSATVVEIDQSTGAVLRNLANIGGATGIATDPISGDLFVTQPGGSGVYRISNPTGASPTVSLYIGRGADGIAFGPDGTMYLASGGVAIVAGTNAPSPGSLIALIQNPALAGLDGIALLPPPPGDTGESIAVNSNFGNIVEIDNPLTANPIFHNIVTGGSRGDFATVGPDGCLYATQTSSVEKVTSSDGSCPFVPSICLPNPTVPQVHVAINGAVFNYNDPGLALTNAGTDGECNGTNESQPWQQIDQGKSGPINIPLPPAITLALQAAPATGHIVGQSQAFTVAAMDGAGHTVPNVAVQLVVSGANPQQPSATTDANGTATFSYSSLNAGTDTVQATAFVSGLRSVSNAVSIQWTIPAPGGPTASTSGPAPPSVVITSPADGTPISGPTAITATVSPPPSSPISTWTVTYQNVSGGAATVLASGSGAPPTTIATLDPTGLVAGTYAIAVSATTGAAGTASAVTRIIVGGSAGAGTAAQAPPTISAPSPADGTIVTKPVPVTATITAPAGQSIASWSVSYQAQDLQPAVTIARGSGAPSATLAIFDPTLLPNDTYAINVTATTSGGGTQTATTTVAVFGNLKLGRYVTTYQDLSVPVNGFQMEVRRVYDSIDKRVGDFGFGWHVDLANFRVSVNRQLGASGWNEYPTQCIFGLCWYGFKTSVPHFATVTFPDQHQEVFDFTPQGGAGILYWQGSAGFTARPGAGTTSTLEVSGDSSLSYDFAGNLTGASGYYNPTRFKLTTHDGRVLILDTALGLVSETDRNGNSLKLDANGVHSSSGQSITYTRDNAGRITKITGPSNELLSYSYSTAGDLVSSIDPNNNTTSYSYDANHDLLKSSGQSGPLETLQYDASGRLSAVTDAAGNTSQITNNVSGQQQTVLDPAGKLTTVWTYDNLGDALREDRVSGGQTLTTTSTFDSTGHPLTRTDPAGNVWTGTFDGSGQLTALSLPSTHTTTVAYDSTGRVTSFSDALGHARTYAYDGQGNLATYTNAAGAKESFASDASGHVLTSTDALGHSTTFSYDAAGNVIKTVDPLGHATSQTYDASGRVLTQTDALNDTTTYAYDGNGNIISITDPLGNISRFTYNSLNLVTSTTDAAGKVTTYTYDSDNRLASQTDPLSRTTSYAYDADSRLLSVTDPTGAITSYVYDGFGRLSSETDGLGHTTSFAYDALGRPIQTTKPNGGIVADVYSIDGHLTKETDSLGRTTAYGYDAVGHLTTTTDPLGLTTSRSYDPEGRLASVTDPLGNTTSRTYDANGQLTSITDPLGRVTTYAYDAAGNRVSTTDPLGHAATTAYDATNVASSVTDPLGRTTSYGHDAAGQLTSMTAPSGATASIVYDPRGLVASITDALNRTTRYAYDDAGQLTSVTDPLGHATTYGYDGAGRQAKIVDALGGTASFAFDAGGEQVSVANPNGNVTKRTYDSLGNLATETNPAGGVTSYSYDLEGQLVRTTDPRGIVVTYGYDADGRQITQGTPGGTITTTYDNAGRRSMVVDQTGTTTYAYDRASQLTSMATPQGTLGYGYDAAGNRSSMRMPSGQSITYAYDAANELTQLKDLLGNTTTLTYNSNGNLSSITRPNGVVTSLAYDAAQQLVGLNQDGPSGSITHDSYTYDAAGNRTSFTSSGGKEQYNFDALNRLTQAAYPNGDIESFTYDAAGNRTSTTMNAATTNYTYNASGQLTAAGSKGYTYDAAGNVTSAGTSTFNWDYANRLSSATVGGTTSSYSYNSDSVRTSMTTGSTTSSYVTDSASGLGLVVDDGSSSYVDAGTNLLEQVGRNGSTTYPLADGLGSVRQVSDSTGTVVSSTAYDVFGSVRSQSGTGSIFGFTGQQTDPTGLLYLRARYFDGSVGRFLTPDTLQPNAAGTQGFNTYSYLAGNPVAGADPTGHGFVEYALKVAAVAVVIGAVAGAIFCPHDANYRMCIVRSALLGLLAGLVFVLFPEDFAIFGSPLAGACVAGAVSGAASAGVDQLSQQSPDLGGLAAAAGIGCVSAGLGKYLPKALGGILRRDKPAIPEGNNFPKAKPVPRLPGDAARENNYPKPPQANGGNGKIGPNAAQANKLQDWLQYLKGLDPPARDVRVNQEQVDVNGLRVGQNRPDLQFTWNNQRYYVEFDTPDSPRGYPHAQRICANDAAGIVILVTSPNPNNVPNQIYSCS